MWCFTNKHRIPFQIDDSDFEIIANYSCCLNGNYVKVSVNRKSILLHYFLLGKPPAGLEWDHKNRDKLDYRRENLRAVTHTVNTRNVGVRKDNISGVAGVGMRGNRWYAHIAVNKKVLHLGYFRDKDQAIRARKDAELRFWGKSLDKTKIDLDSRKRRPAYNSKSGISGITPNGHKWRVLITLNKPNILCW